MSTNKIKLSPTHPDRHDPSAEPDDMSNVVADIREGGGRDGGKRVTGK